MERLRERINLAAKALETLEDVETIELPAGARRDVAIMRLVYTFEALWRALQRYLAVVEGVEAGTPKSCLRAARDAGLLSDEQTEAALKLVDDRNLTVHIYNDALAAEIFGRVPGHIGLMRTLLDDMSKKIEAV
ncbi:MAG: nucleotidyltransferase substrate binding protein [Proteobacteria bacterium]|nr:nucleotidyltransferase substrate binding protein [Pseudomonadota bacterium]